MNSQRIITHHNTEANKSKSYVLYWLQSTQRFTDNMSLKVAIDEANRLELPLKVLFILNPRFKDANTRHYTFMLEGLKHLKKTFEKHQIPFFFEIGDFESVTAQYLKDAASFILDYSVIAPLRKSRAHVIQEAKDQNIRTLEVVSDLIVPPHVASDKCEYSARTIRSKLQKRVDAFLDLPSIPKLKHTTKSKTTSLDQPILALLKECDAPELFDVSDYFKGGEHQALKRLESFVDNKLNDYDQSSDPAQRLVSTLSPYLHFGMISPVRVYLVVLDAMQKGDVKTESAEGFLEQLLVRRELAHNFVLYCEGYDRFETMTYAWAYETMKAHEGDLRETTYTKEELVASNTHDIYFNAAMREMVETGFMHNYMRMYWGKKIIEWSADYNTAYETILSLNNHYFLDGRDANSYASVAWLFGRHDRAWQEREIFGKLRYMNANGLKRKFDIDAYVTYTNELKKR